MLLREFVHIYNAILYSIAQVATSMRFNISNEEQAGRIPALRLTYFDVKGLAECVRLTLNYAGIPYADERLSTEAFDERKSELPYGQVPVLSVDNDVTLAQSKTILRFTSKYARTYSSKAIDAAMMDQWVDLHTEFMTPLTLNMYPEKYGVAGLFDKSEHRKWCVEVHIPRFLGMLDAELSKHSGWLAGMDHLSMADFCWLPTLEWLKSGTFDGVGESSFDQFEQLTNYMVEAREHLDDETDPGTSDEEEVDELAVDAKNEEEKKEE